MNDAIRNVIKQPTKRDKRHLEDGVDLFFHYNPDDYWDKIEEERQRYNELLKLLKTKSSERDIETDTHRKRKIEEEEIAPLQNQSLAKKARIDELEEQARQRDEGKEEKEERTGQEFLKMYPDNYRERLNEVRLDLIRDLFNIQDHMKKYQGVTDGRTIQALNEEALRMRTAMKHRRKNLNAFSKAVMKKDLQLSTEEYERTSYEQNKDYVEPFFDSYPTDYWEHIHKKYEGLQKDYKKIRELREQQQFLTDEQKKQSIQDDIDQLRRLIDYRRKRFAALEYEAKKRDALLQQHQNPVALALTHGEVLKERIGKIDGTTSTTTTTRQHGEETKTHGQSLVELIDQVQKERSASDTGMTRGEILGQKLKHKVDEDVERITHADILKNRLQQISRAEDRSEAEQTRGEILGSLLKANVVEKEASPEEKTPSEVPKNKLDEIVGEQQGKTHAQLGYILGFEDPTKILNGDIAKYHCDLKGGIDSLCVYINALSIFSLPPTNVSVSSSSVREYLPLNPLTDIPFHFKIHPSTSFIDLNKCYILTEMSIKRFDTDTNKYVNLKVNEQVATINMIGATWIKNIKITVQGREIYDSNSLYAYKAYLDTELSYSKNVKESDLQASGYYVDSENQDDVFNQDRYMVNGVEIDIQLTPNDNEFMIMAASDDKYRIEITACKLYIKNLEVVDGLAVDIQKILENKEAKYAHRKTLTKSIFISENRTEYNGTLFTGQLPKRVILGMVENTAYVGNQKKSPFNFRPFDVRSVTLTANGKQWPAAPFELNFSNNLYTRAFHEMNEALGMASSTDSNGITLEKYRKGWTIFAFNMTNSMEENECIDLITEGTTTVSILFRSPVPAGGISLIAMSEMDSILILDKNRTVMTDMTV
ncbi:hypothetical protein niasHT_027945 [Heterodera trifolii]|uniref:Uncharacterized protein n=1 Tax=Heterodera trifolii TaxID=157864 RepID=A0ABD2JWY1_9BILA